MTATKKFDEVKDQPGYGEFLEKPERWRLRLLGAEPLRAGIDWKCESPFGSVEGRVVTDSEGRPVFDRPVYREAPNVNVVAWGMDKDGVPHFAVVSQPRPHADDPENAGDSHVPVVFGQIPMGFLDKIMGKDQYEGIRAAAVRETEEESGAQVVLEIERPQYQWHNPNPTFVATWSELVFVKVDLERVGKHRSTRNEPIFKAEYIPINELFRRIREGKDESDAVYRSATSNSAWMVFFASHPMLLANVSAPE